MTFLGNEVLLIILGLFFLVGHNVTYLRKNPRKILHFGGIVLAVLSVNVIAMMLDFPRAGLLLGMIVGAVAGAMVLGSWGLAFGLSLGSIFGGVVTLKLAAAPVLGLYVFAIVVMTIAMYLEAIRLNKPNNKLLNRHLISLISNSREINKNKKV